MEFDKSTSTVASPARRGDEPTLHVTNGESVAGTLRTTSLGGVVLSWADALHVGPLAAEPAESRAVRATFLATHGWGERTAIAAELERRDGLLARAIREGNLVVLWFEHDLFDQLQLLQVLSQAAPAARVELVQAGEHLGPLDAAALERLWETRSPVAPATFELARAAWRAVCDDDLEQALELDTRALPYLEPALRRLLEERSPLSRTKRQLLAALADGPKTTLELFVANQTCEEAPFLGDTWCFLFLSELAENGLVTPLPPPPPGGEGEAFVTATVALTPEGRSLVSDG